MAFDVSTCAVSGLFSIGEDFDDEDLLGSDWAVGSSSAPAVPPVAVASCSLRASSVSLRGPETNRLQPSAERPAARCHGAASHSDSTHAAAGPTAPAPALRRPSSSSSSSALPPPPTPDASRPNSASRLSPAAPQDDFDDWDVDLADLDECDRQTAPPPARGPPAPSCKTLRPPNGGGVQAHPDRPPRDIGATFVPTPPPPASSAPLLRSPNPRPPAHPSPAPAPPPPSPGVFPGLTASSPGPGPISRTIATPRRSWATPPGPSPRGHALFESVSPAPSSSPSPSPRPRHTPVFTNRLVQLVSASNKPPSKRPRSEAHRPRTRRFPGPAGFLPQQPQGQNLDDIVVSVPQTPAHGAVARSPSQGSSSQTDEDEFGAGGWAAMKAEMGLDERNPSCFLHSYSVVMVLRKAALKQLAKNKVPNMAVLLKSIIHTHADAKAVFRDPTGEIQGTVHRRLLEERAEELQVGSVLLLKQVGVFSPSHRNHYLNVTPNNLLRIYAPDGAAPSSSSSSSARLPPLLLEPMSQAGSPPAALQETVSRMQLVFDEEEEEEDEEGGEHPKAPRDTRAGSPAPLDAGWDADDDLDELLGELPEESCSL